MAREKKEKPAGGASASGAPTNAAPTNPPSRNIFALANRGLLLDIFVFLFNLILMRMLTKQFVALFRQASDGDPVSGFVIFLFCIGLFVLPAAGAVLKRWHFHRRLQMQGKTVKEDGFVFGCLFNPIIYYSLNLLIFVVITVFVQGFIYGDEKPGGAVTASFTLLAVIVPIVQTFLVYRYFSPPKRDPPAFFRSPLSEHLGDICIFLNMISFQLVLNWLMFSYLGFPRVSGFYDFFAKFLFLIAVSLFLYFPPRIFYLAEDITRRRTWLTMLLANAPLIFRALIGTNPSDW